MIIREFGSLRFVREQRKLAQETGNLGLILIDYPQLITGTGEKTVNREVSEISRQLKIFG